MNETEICMGSSANLHQDSSSQTNPCGKESKTHHEIQCKAECQVEELPCNLLYVKIIQIKNLRKAELFRQSDCYISLFLPTASFERVRTKAIKDCKDPLWNEIFFFRIQNQVKNILELKVHDEDNCLTDSRLRTILFDVSKIQLKETVPLTFPLDPKIKEELEVEFTLESSPVHCERIVSNGVLVSREISCLKVQVNGEKLKEKSRENNFTFTLQGSYEEKQTVSLDTDSPPANSAVFHYIKYKQSTLAMEVSKTKSSTPSLCPFGNKNAVERVCLTLPLDSHSMKKEITIAKDKTIDLHVQVEDWPKYLDMRLGYDLCMEEQIFMQKRKKIAAASLKKILHLDKDLLEHEVPLVAVMATGGGARAYTALHGHLFGLQKLNILDCLSYISGSSGSTWALSNLYEHADWSQQDLSGAIAEARRNVTKCKLNLWCLENLQEYSNELEKRQKEGFKTCITDLWGLLIEKGFGNGNRNSTLSGQKHALNHGQNPMPMYVVLNTKDKYSLSEFKEWIEFTPYEVGLLKYGAYIRSEDFGSEFFLGHLMKKVPESQICFMKGMWSNVFSYHLMDASCSLDSSESSLQRCTRDRVNDIEERPPQPSVPHELNTHLVIPACNFSKIVREVLTKRVTTSECYNFLKGFQLHNGYLDNKNFDFWKDTILDTFPNQLTVTSEYLSIVDVAACGDFSYPSLMRPERKVDVILHLNYSSGSQTSTLTKASEYFSKQGIPFPKVDTNNFEEKNLKECYVFEDAENPEAPIVVFFPLINDTFRKYKAPGVERSSSELKQGDVKVSSPLSPYGLQNFQYTEEDFDKLVELTSYNIQNNKSLILQALQRAVDRKKTTE